METMLSREILLLLVVVGVVLYYMRRSKKRKAAETYHLAYAGYSEPGDAAGEDFATVFSDMVPAQPEGTTLFRLSLMNRGEKTAEAAAFGGPLAIVLPPDSRVLQACAAQSNSRTRPESVSVSSRLNRVEIAPFDLPGRSSMIFNIVVEGPAEPYTLEGRLEDQERLEPLR